MNSSKKMNDIKMYFILLITGLVLLTVIMPTIGCDYRQPDQSFNCNECNCDCDCDKDEPDCGCGCLGCCGYSSESVYAKLTVTVNLPYGYEHYTQVPHKIETYKVSNGNTTTPRAGTTGYIKKPLKVLLTKQDACSNEDGYILLTVSPMDSLMLPYGFGHPLPGLEHVKVHITRPKLEMGEAYDIQQVHYKTDENGVKEWEDAWPELKPVSVQNYYNGAKAFFKIDNAMLNCIKIKCRYATDQENK